VRSTEEPRRMLERLPPESLRASRETITEYAAAAAGQAASAQLEREPGRLPGTPVRRTPWVIRSGWPGWDPLRNRTGAAAGEVHRRASLQTNPQVENNPQGGRALLRLSGTP